jgi:hypothetical protein
MIVGVTFALLLVACGGQQILPVLVQPTSTLPLPTPTATSTLGVVKGILVEKGTQKPVTAVKLQLTPVSINAEGKTQWSFSPNNPQAESDLSGAFSFVQVSPGKYSIWAFLPSSIFFSPVTDEGGNQLIFEVKAGQILDTGKTLVGK